MTGSRRFNPLPAYSTLRRRSELARANSGFLDALKATATHRAKQTIGTAGGSSFVMTWYAPTLDLWIAPDVLDNRTWNALGKGDPFQQSKVAPALEINFPLRAGSSMPAGIALIDELGVTAFAHTGRVGGGKPGVGLAAFRAYHPWTERVMIDGRARDVYLLGDLSDEENLASNVSDFVHTVADFKAGVAPTSRTPSVVSPFHPEFEGTAHYTVVADDRRATYVHGRVVNSLYRSLGALDIQASRTQSIDLFSEATAAQHGVIFEAKTSTDTQAVYTCIGQLFLLAPDPAWLKVAVLPDPVPSVVSQRLAAIGVAVLPYSLSPGGVPTFADLLALVQRLHKTRMHHD